MPLDKSWERSLQPLLQCPVIRDVAIVSFKGELQFITANLTLSTEVINNLIQTFTEQISLTVMNETSYIYINIYIMTK